MNQVSVRFRVRGVIRQEGNFWVAGFPRLDVYSQGGSVEEAKENASDALRLWIDSCLDRGTMGPALRELGWHRSNETAVAADPNVETIEMVHIEDVLGEPWEQQIDVPAYQAAEFLAAAM